MGLTFKRILLFIIAPTLVGAMLFGLWKGWEFKEFVDQPARSDVTLTIKKGWGLNKIARTLEAQGVTPSAKRFTLLTQHYGEGYIQAGEYRIKAGETQLQILDRLRRGDVTRWRFGFPEGLNVKQIAQRMQKKGWADADVVAFDPDLPKKLGVQGDRLEGWLFPETYFFNAGDDALMLITRMVERTKEILAEEYAARDPAVKLTPYEALILASIIEKETGQAHERRRISAVFHNRLKKRMRLQTDPTVIYGIKDFDGDIKRKHLKEKTPYNTYVIRGLPPTPIANPGQASIHAALHPEENAPYLYFVAKGNGEHHFSKTLKEHNRNVTKYQKNRKYRQRMRKKG